MTIDDELHLIKIEDAIRLLTLEIKELKEDIAELQQQYEALTSGEEDGE
jgi:FtsZ-binding cell division protein ZapB